MMKFSVPKCPTCGEVAEGTVDIIPGVAYLEFNEDGTAEHTGETDVWWDDQYTERDDAGDVDLYCENAHRWTSGMEETE